MEQMRISVEGIDDRGFEIAGRDAVAVTNNIDRPVGRPLLLQFGDNTGQIGIGIGSRRGIRLADSIEHQGGHKQTAA